MKRKLLSLILAAVLCLSLGLTAGAATADAFVVDEMYLLEEEELAMLNDLAGQILRERGVGIFYVYTTTDPLSDYDVEALVGDLEDYYVVLENETHWRTAAGGAAMALDETAEEALRDVYDLEETYVGGVEQFLYAAAECFPLLTAAPETKAPQAAVTASGTLLYDEAGLLSEAEAAALEAQLAQISQTWQTQIVVATIASMDGGDIDTFVDYLYDSMGFGYGPNRDGALLLVCMDPREYRILTNGLGSHAMGTDEIDSICDVIVSDLSAGYYADAFGAFAEECDYYLDGHINGFPFDAGKSLAIALIIGVLAGGITAFTLKSQLKSVRRQNQANVYVKDGSMNVTTRSDLYLYRNVTRTKKESSSGSSGGSSRSKGGGSF